jgi:hypothetical protein
LKTLLVVEGSMHGVQVAVVVPEDEGEESSWGVAVWVHFKLGRL